MVKIFSPAFFFALASIMVCQKASPQPAGEDINSLTFNSYSHFRSTLERIALPTTGHTNPLLISAFWDSLKNRHQIPYVFGDSVAFLYYGKASSVSWAGDFDGWDPSMAGFQGNQLGTSPIWIMEQVFPEDARLDYKIVVDGEWILDPDNPNIQYSGWGPNSELRMPGWMYPEETVLAEGISRGTLSENMIIMSREENLGYTVQYRVYLPHDYENLSDLPVIYVTDGHEYSDDLKGSMVIVLDNLIHKQMIRPVMAVFIDPRNPEQPDQNRRMEEYTGNPGFADFVADELIPEIDSQYKTSVGAEYRAILGTSLGGWNSAFIGFKRSDKIHHIGIHSPAFDESIIQAFSNSEKLPLNIFMSTGVIYDTQDRARAMKAVLEEKSYPLRYIEVNEGHSWGNWRALIDEPLIYFYGQGN